MNNLTEIDHASMPLGIFASKSVFRKTNLGGVGTPPYVAKLISCWHSNTDLHKKIAFTLAEVLITLGIIGVVAAMTLPTVIQNYKKQLTLNKIKHTYTVLNNTIERAKADYGTNVNEWYIPDGNNLTKSMYFVENYMLPYLSVLEYCKDNSTGQNCKEWGKYIGERGDGEYLNPTNSYGTNFVLNDGTNVYVKVGRGSTDEAEETNRVMIDFDIDGATNGINMFGNDIFRIELGGYEGSLSNDADKNRFLPFRYIPTQPCSYYVGTRPHACSNNAQYAGGSMCLAYIVCNGWSFGNKYPW